MKKEIYSFYIDKQQTKKASNISSLNGNEKVIDTISVDNIEVLLKEMDDSQDEKMTYIADWKYDDVVYL